MSSKKQQEKASYFFAIGQNFLMENEIPQAISYFKQALNLEPKNSVYLMNLGIAFMRIEQFDQSEAKFKESLQENKDFPEAWNNLSALYIKMRRFDDSIMAADNALKDLTYSTPSLALANKGRAYFHKRDLGRCMDVLRLGLRREPSDCGIRLLLSKALHRQGIKDESLTHAQSAASLCTDDPSPQIWLAYLTATYGDKNNSKEQYQSIVRKYKVGPEIDKARRAITRLTRGDLVEDPSDEF